VITHTHQEEASHIPQDDFKRRAEEDVRKRIVILPADSPQGSFVVNRDRDLPTKTGLWNSSPKTGKSNFVSPEFAHESQICMRLCPSTISKSKQPLN